MKAYKPLVSLVGVVLVCAVNHAQAQAIALDVSLDRPAGVYAVGDTVALRISAARDVTIRVWLREPSGRLSPVIPSTPSGEPSHVRAGERTQLPRSGGFRVTPPVGQYEFLVTATTDEGANRSLTSADSRLAGQDRREQRTLPFRVEQP